MTQSKVTIDPLVAYNETLQVANFYKDRCLFLANRCHELERELTSLKEVASKDGD